MGVLTIAQVQDILTGLVDAGTDKLSFSDYPHDEVHAGKAFMLHQITAANALDIASPLTYRMRPILGDKHAHLTVEVDVTAAARIEIFEQNNINGHFTVSGGTKVIPWNRNRNKSVVSIINCWTGVTVGAASVKCRIWGQRLGGFKAVGNSSMRHELVLQSGGDYLIRLTTDADNNEGSLNLDWYEHTDRNP